MRDVEDCLVYWDDHDLLFVPHLVGHLFVTVTGQETVRHLGDEVSHAIPNRGSLIPTFRKHLPLRNGKYGEDRMMTVE